MVRANGYGEGEGGIRNWSLSPAHPRRLWDHVVMADTLAEIKRKVTTNADLLLGDVHQRGGEWKGKEQGHREGGNREEEEVWK